MQEKTNSSLIKTLIFTSPYFLLVFIVIPIYTVIAFRLRLPVSGDLLLANNACFLLFIAGRFVRYALKMRGDIRYGADYRQPGKEFILERPMPVLRGELEGSGYRFDAGGRYGEKRDTGFLGTTVMYGGLLLLLLFGSYDYLREYSIMVRLGVGEPMPLTGKGLVGEFEAGNLAASSSLPQLQVRKQILPNAQWPKGATEIALLDKDRKELAKATIAPGKPFRYAGLDYHMTRFLFDALLVIRQGRTIIYDNFVKFLPLVEKKGVYSYYGGLVGKETGKVKGGAWLNPEKKAVRMEATLDGKTIFAGELELWGENKKTQGEFLASIDGLAHWSEIRVARGRHLVMLVLGAVIAVLGGIIRVAVRPQRVWLEEAGTGCRARATGGRTMKLLQIKQ
jgi:hypothetical protein